MGKHKNNKKDTTTMTTHGTLELARFEHLLPIETKAKPIICRQDMPVENTIYKGGAVMPMQQLSELTRMLVSNTRLSAAVYLRPMSVQTPDEGLLDKLHKLQENTDIEVILPHDYVHHGDPPRVCFSLAQKDGDSKYHVDQPIRPLSIDEGAWFVADDIGVIGDIPVLIDSSTMTAVSIKAHEGIHVSEPHPDGMPGHTLNGLLEQKTRALRESTVRTIGATVYCRAIEVEQGRHIA